MPWCQTPGRIEATRYVTHAVERFILRGWKLGAS
jgi:hypothetical protein